MVGRCCQVATPLKSCPGSAGLGQGAGGGGTRRPTHPCCAPEADAHSPWTTWEPAGLEEGEDPEQPAGLWVRAELRDTRPV